jgi:hypothetical protein
MQVCQTYRRHILEVVEFSHLLRSAADFATGVVAPDSQSIEFPGPMAIGGAAVQAGDTIEIRSGVAATLRVPPGVWEATTDQIVTLTNPPTYTATSTDFMGLPWRFQINANNELEGLVLAAYQNTTIQQHTIAVNGPLRIFDNNISTAGDAASLSSNQGVTVNFTEISPIRMEFLVSSVKTRADAKYPSAALSIRRSHSTNSINNFFINYKTGTRAWNGTAHVWSSGALEWWYSDVLTNVAISTLAIADNGGSRATPYHLGCLVSGNSRISIDGEFPPNGAIVTIPESVANQLRPVQPAGDYTVLENSGTAPWRLQRP